MQTRADILALLKNPFETGWGGLFSRGSAIGNREGYPSIGEIQRVLEGINHKLYPALESLDEDQLAQPFQGLELPNVKTAAGQLATFALHDSYHVGQLAYIRKGLGYSAIVG